MYTARKSISSFETKPAVSGLPHPFHSACQTTITIEKHQHAVLHNFDGAIVERKSYPFQRSNSIFCFRTIGIEHAHRLKLSPVLNRHGLNDAEPRYPS